MALPKSTEARTLEAGPLLVSVLLGWSSTRKESESKSVTQRLGYRPPTQSYKKGVSNLEGRCMKCRENREIKDATEVVMKNGKPAVTGTCAVCGTKMFRIGKNG